MSITRISKIRVHRIFRDFTWPTDLQPFAQFNLIYGWNGSGKTTLSSLFCNLQTLSVITEGEVEFEINGETVRGTDLDTAQLPAVRVFNNDFIESTILAAGTRMEPIYYLGENSVEKQKQVTALKKELAESQSLETSAQSSKHSAAKALDDFCINKAKIIKELLISSWSTKYNNYNKGHFRLAIEKLTQDSATDALLVDEDKVAFRKQKDAQPKDTVSKIVIEVPDFDAIALEAEALLSRSVVSQVLEELAADSDVSSWVQQGLSLHSGDRKSDTCRFCGVPIPVSRVQSLEAHFNDALTTFQAELTELAERVESKRVLRAQVQFPELSGFYDHLITELKSAISEVRRLLAEAGAYCGLLHDILLRKHKAPFQAFSLATELKGKIRPNRTELEKAIDVVNAVIQKHNATTNDFQREVQRACEKLEECYVAEAFSDWRQFSGGLSSSASALESFVNKNADLKHQIAAIEKEIVEHRRPAEELNIELRSYLGQDDLLLDVKETGYTITRRGQPASYLSEGEKTATAFLYFLKSLQDKSFHLAQGVVVIDDPVSSLDANALFSAFGYMKERTKGAGQLFVLTHNFGFFRQVKNWFHHLPNQKKKDVSLRPGRFYMLTTNRQSGERTASITAIDPMLEEHESEYHYLFKRIHQEANRDDGGIRLEDYYGMPNQARRLMEAFLAFRYPDGSDDLSKKLDRVDFDPGKKTRILRFLHTYSHSAAIAYPEHDPSVLSETKPVLCDLLNMIKQCDPSHYDGMMRIISTGEVGTDE